MRRKTAPKKRIGISASSIKKEYGVSLKEIILAARKLAVVNIGDESHPRYMEQSVPRLIEYILEIRKR